MNLILAFRLKNARLKNGLSLQQVADKIGVSKQMISKYEKGLSMPTSAMLIRLATLFEVKIDQLFQKPGYEVGEISFRKRSKLKGKREIALKESIKSKIENYLLIEDLLGISHEFKNPLAHHQISSVSEAKMAAYALKEAWNIGQDAIYNGVDLLEEKHIKVIEIEDLSGDFDGLATWVDHKYPLLVLSKNTPIERKRFTLFHELGHLILPMNQLNHSEKEKKCNAFASEMLLSKANLEMELGNSKRKIFLEEIKNLQEKYGISVAAIIYKLEETGYLRKYNLRDFFIRISSDSDFKQEIEQSRYLGTERSNRFENLVFRALSQEMISLSKASSLLDIRLSDLKSVLLQAV